MSLDNNLMKIRKSFNSFVYKMVVLRRKQYQISKMKKWSNCLNEELTEDEKKQVDRFYKPYKYNEGNAQRYYKSITGHFDHRYISEDMQFCKIDPFYNDWYAANIIDNKCYYDLYFPDLKMPEVVAYRINNIWFDKDKKLKTIQTIIKESDSLDNLFIKQAQESSGGHGVTYLKSFEINEFNTIIKDIKCDIIIQKAIRQHQELARLNPQSVNTIRSMSLLSQDGVKIYSSVLRMGVGNAKVDNASSGGIVCGINDDGRLNENAFDNKGNKYPKVHPTTKVAFSDILIPNFEELKKQIINSHLKMPTFRLISWDFAINEKGEPIFIECNLCHGELEFHQFNNGPIYKEDTQKILDEVFKK